MELIEFDKKCKCGPDYAAVRILDNGDDLKVGNVWLPTSTEKNSRLAFCKIEDIGWKAREERGLEAGDYVLIDRLSTFSHTAPIALVRWNNIIVKANSSNTEFWPLRNTVMVEADKQEDVTNLNGVYLPSYKDKLKTGTILKINCDESLKLTFKVGDKVLLSKNGDVVQIGMSQMHIYPYDMIVCSIEE